MHALLCTVTFSCPRDHTPTPGQTTGLRLLSPTEHLGSGTALRFVCLYFQVVTKSFEVGELLEGYFIVLENI